MSNNLYGQPVRAVFAYLGKRIILLAAKLAGFKSLCLALATVLLVKGLISGSIWLSAMITVICGNTGMRIAGAWQKEEYDDQPDTKNSTRSDCSAAADPAVQRAARRGKERIRKLLSSGSNTPGD
jgi:hypothetical protein